MAAEKGVESVRYIECHCCGRLTERTAPNKKYCKSCAGKLTKSRRRRKPAGPGKLLDWHDLRGKSLRRVDAEARAFGLSYGQYTAAVYSGGIDALLRSKGFHDPEAVLRKVRAR